MLKRLTETMGVSGREDAVRELIRAEILPHCTEVRTDSMGNLIAYKKGTRCTSAMGAQGGDGIVLTAHMDEVGFLITDITPDGYLKFDTVGGIEPSVLISKRVLVNGHSGVISFKAIHLTSKEEREKPVRLSSLCIDIGADSREEAQRYVQVGDCCGFDSEYVEFGANKVKAKALDDRAGCCILMELLKREWAFDLTCLFTVQEEVGLRGAKAAICGMHPDYAVVVEATTCNDMTDVEEGQRVTEQGRGAAVSVLDGASCANEETVRLLTAAARDCGAPCQWKASTRGGNDAGSVHVANGGIRTASISIPCRYIHSAASVMDMRDYNSCLAILTQFLENMPAQRGTNASAAAVPATDASAASAAEWGEPAAMLRELCGIFAVSGREAQLARYIARRLEPYADEVRIDSMNNVLVHFRGEGEPLMLECGMDSDGLMVTGCSDPKKVRFAAAGSPKPEELPGRRVRFLGGASGIVCGGTAQAEPAADKPKKPVKIEELYIELDDGETSVGDFAEVKPGFCDCGDGTVCAENLAARAAVLCLMETARMWRGKNAGRETWFLFSAQKRLGGRGARAAIGGIDPGLLLTLQPRRTEKAGEMGILVKEKNAVAHLRMRDALERAARECGAETVPVVEKENYGAEQLSLAGSGVLLGGLYFPVESGEKGTERVCIKNIASVQNLLLQFPHCL